MDPRAAVTPNRPIHKLNAKCDHQVTVVGRRLTALGHDVATCYKQQSDDSTTVDMPCSTMDPRILASGVHGSTDWLGVWSCSQRTSVFMSRSVPAFVAVQVGSACWWSASRRVRSVSSGGRLVSCCETSLSVSCTATVDDTQTARAATPDCTPTPPPPPPPPAAAAAEYEVDGA